LQSIFSFSYSSSLDFSNFISDREYLKHNLGFIHKIDEDIELISFQQLLKDVKKKDGFRKISSIFSAIFWQKMVR
jgi:hypothetical protein